MAAAAATGGNSGDGGRDPTTRTLLGIDNSIQITFNRKMRSQFLTDPMAPTKLTADESFIKRLERLG